VRFSVPDASPGDEFDTENAIGTENDQRPPFSVPPAFSAHAASPHATNGTENPPAHHRPPPRRSFPGERPRRRRCRPSDLVACVTHFDIPCRFPSHSPWSEHRLSDWRREMEALAQRIGLSPAARRTGVPPGSRCAQNRAA
jgi:hypothetical protein